MLTLFSGFTRQSHGVFAVSYLALSCWLCACASAADETEGQGASVATSSSVASTTVASSSTGVAGCDADFKLCADECVSIDDPAYGCGATTCSPCGPHAIYSCQSNSCVFEQCALGYGNCDGNPVNGCEAPLDDDPNACGACGRTCGGAACTDGVCAPQVLVTEQEQPVKHIAVDEASLYWTSDSGGGYRIRRAAKGGGAASTLFDGMSVTPAPIGIAIDDANVYWYAANALITVPKGGGAATTLASGIPDASSMATNEQYVFLRSPDKILRIAKAGGAVSELATDLSAASGPGTNTAGGIAAGSGRVFYAQGRAGPENQGEGVNLIYAVPASGGSPVEISSGTPDPLGGAWLSVSTDGGQVFWTENNSGFRIKGAPTSGGAAQLVVQAGHPIGTMMTTSNSLVWSDTVGLFHVALSGGETTLLYPQSVSEVVADSAFYYFVHSNPFEIVRVAR